MVAAQRSVQLAVRGGSVLRPLYLLTDLCLPDGRERLRLAAIADFNALRRSECALHDRVGACRPPSGRMRVILQALDGSLSGVSQREIAEALFGSARVRRDWRDAGGHLRDHVRRAIRRGRLLMKSGYQELLVR